eukprot:827433-Amorphochlora_amoeboformis.AAC.1
MKEYIQISINTKPQDLHRIPYSPSSERNTYTHVSDIRVFRGEGHGIPKKIQSTERPPPERALKEYALAAFAGHRWSRPTTPAIMIGEYAREELKYRTNNKLVHGKYVPHLSQTCPAVVPPRWGSSTCGRMSSRYFALFLSQILQFIRGISHIDQCSFDSEAESVCPPLWNPQNPPKQHPNCCENSHDRPDQGLLRGLASCRDLEGGRMRRYLAFAEEG